MRLTLIDDHPRVRKSAAPAERSLLRLAAESIEAVVIDEHRRPVELVPGAAALKVSGAAAVLNVDLPLMPGSRVLLQVGPRNAIDAAGKRFELEVLACKKCQRGHRVVTRVVSEVSHVPMHKAA